MARRSLTIALAITLLATAAASAGPVLDDILNYMYRDQTTPIHARYEYFLLDTWRNLTKDEPIGQTFVTGPEATKIIRIRCKIEPDADWQKGEGVEMVLWDSPAKTVALGRYTVGFEFRGFGFSQPEFEVRADVKPNTQYYFEMSYAGSGDGKLSRVALMNGQDSYKDGQGYLAGKAADFDVCFQTHVKKAPDRVGNLNRAFARFNLDMPQLAEVKGAVDKQDFDTAEAELVSYFENRQKPIPTLGAVKAFPGFDIKEADLALDNYFQSTEMGKGYAGPDINWRAIPDFNSDGTIAASGWNTGMNRFGPRGPLTKGYLATGDDKYVKKLNDVLIDWYLDNPPPGISHIGGDGTDCVWATLDAGIRLAANFICYSRIVKSPAFTLDGRMAYILNLADEADTLVLNGAGDGGNWSFTQNAAMFAFALNFPEYANAPTWRDTAAQRVAGTIKKDVLPDGVECEAAPGYQRMSYGPLVSIYNLMLERGVRIPFSDKLKGIIEKQAEYFMYLAMPNGVTPYFGDWGHTEERIPLKGDSALLGRQDMLYVATQGKEGVRPTQLSKIYPYYGILTMRSDWGDAGQPYEDARYLFFHGYRRGAHGHSDLNELTCYAYGRELLADPGVGVYGSPQSMNLMTTPSHNAMTIDGQNGERWPSTSWKCWSTTPVADYVSSWVDSYKAGDYNREVFYVRANGDPGAGEYWVVRDTAGGEGTHSLEQRWHLYPGPSEFDKDTLTARTAFDKGGNLSIMQVDPSRLTCEEAKTDTWVTRGSDRSAATMPTFVYKMNTSVPAAIDTVLFPYKGKRQPKVQLTVLEKQPNGLSSTFKMVQGKVEDIFSLQQSAKSKDIPSEKITFDGERLFLRKVKGKVRSVLLVNGSSLSVDGKQIIKSALPTPWVSVSFDVGGPTVYTGTKQAGIDVPAGKGQRITTIDTGVSVIVEAANRKKYMP